MTASYYYPGDSIPIVLSISDDTGTLTPTAAVITITDPAGTVQENGTAMTIESGKVKFTLSATKTTVAGEYIFVCKVTLPSGNIRQYKLTKIVKSL